MTVVLIAYSCIAIGIAYFLSQAIRPGITTVPGPWLAKFSNLWRLIETYYGRYQDRIPELHSKYGNLVRLAPDVISISDPRAIECVYGFKTHLEKSDMTKPVQPVLRGAQLPTMFAAQDRKTHTFLRRPVAQSYSTGSVLGFESYVDNAIRYFATRVEELFVQPGKACDIHNWVQYCELFRLREINF